jgi:hypothetical protein
MGHVESRISPLGDGVSVDAPLGMRQTYHWLKNHFGHT